MKLYRITYRICSPKAKNKLVIGAYQGIVPDQRIEIRARTNADAIYQLGRLVLPEDRRPIGGRNSIGTFCRGQL